MSVGISKLFEDAESFADQGRLLLAVQALEEVRRLTQIPDRRALASYNLGAIHWHHLGDGLAARREFLASISDFDAHGYGSHPKLKIIHANALENAMLCALSFNEFENLAARLHTLAPGVPILAELVPQVQHHRERGESWSKTLFALAATYYNRNDPRRDVGRYGEARSTYHLILTHRRELRVSREDWRIALYEFCALSMRMAADCMKVRGGDYDSHPPDEFLPILTEAIPLADEYLRLNSGDDDLQKVRADMEKMVDNYRQRWEALNERRTIMPKKTDYQVCLKCGTVLARLDDDGPELKTGMFYMHDRQICPKCGGPVAWRDTPEIGVPIDYGCLLYLLIIAFLAVLVLVLAK